MNKRLLFGKGSGSIEHFKNPALSRENGVLTAYCCRCGKYIGNEYDTNFYALIRRKYCEEHAQEFHAIQMAISRKTYKAKKQKTVKEMQSVLDETIKTVRMQKEYILALQRELDDLKRGVR